MPIWRHRVSLVLPRVMTPWWVDVLERWEVGHVNIVLHWNVNKPLLPDFVFLLLCQSGGWSDRKHEKLLLEYTSSVSVEKEFFAALRLSSQLFWILLLVKHESCPDVSTLAIQNVESSHCIANTLLFHQDDAPFACPWAPSWFELKATLSSVNPTQ